MESPSRRSQVEAAAAAKAAGEGVPQGRRTEVPGREPSTDAPGRHAAGCEPLSTTTVHGVGSLVFGLPFLAVGVFVVLAASGAIPQEDADFPCGRGIAVLAGAMFGLAGVFLEVNGALGVLRQRRAARGRAEFPGMPWRFDRAWHRDGADAGRWSRAGSVLVMTLVFGAFAALGLSVAWAAGAPWIVKTVATVFALVLLLPVVELVRRVGQALRYGRTYVRWGRFPAFTGERLTLRFGVTRESPRFTRLVVRLRCVEERYETLGSGDDRRTVVSCRALHDDTQTVTDPAAMPRPMCDATVHFDLPRALPGNDLLSRPATFWEAEVVGEAPGLDYRQRFLLPVYARSGDEAEARHVQAPAEAPASSSAW